MRYDVYGLILVGTVVLGTLAAMVWYMPRKFARDDRARRAVPACAVRDLVAGTHVRVIGTAHAIGEPLTGPHTGKPCLVYEAHAYDADGELRMMYGGVTFRLQDDTGTIVVAVEHVKRDLAPELTLTAPRGFGAGVIARNAALADESVPALWESALRPEAQVAVTAIVALDDRGDLVLAGTAQVPIVISTFGVSFEP